MAARRKKTSRRKSAARKAGAALARIEQELPPNLREFSRQVRRGLSDLEKEVARAQANPRREATRLLREASHTLGRLEAEGERRFRKLAGPEIEAFKRELRARGRHADAEALSDSDLSGDQRPGDSTNFLLLATRR